MDELFKNDILDKLKVFENMYDLVRLVDPVKKKVLTIIDDNFYESDFTCFDTWKRNDVCTNCISIRAYNENKTFIKVEYNPKQIFTITSIPVELNGRRIVVELLQESTERMFMVNTESNNII